MLATGSADATTRLWDLASGRERATLQKCCGEIYALAFAPDSRTLVTGSTDATLKFWSATTGQWLNTMSTLLGPLAFTPDSRPMRAATWADKTELREIGTDRVWLTLPEGGPNVTAMRLTRDGRRLLTTDEQGSLKVWNVATQQILTKLTGDAAGIAWLSGSADGRVIVTESRAQVTESWDTGTGQRRWSRPHPENAEGAMNAPP